MSEYRIVPGYFGPRIEAKLGTQRKPKRWSVLPCSDGTMHLSADGACGAFDPETGVGRLNIKGDSFAHLHYALGAKDYTFPPDFVTLCKEVCLEPGGETTRGGVTLVNTIEVI